LLIGCATTATYHTPSSATFSLGDQGDRHRDPWALHLPTPTSSRLGLLLTLLSAASVIATIYFAITGALATRPAVMIRRIVLGVVLVRWPEP